MQRLALLLIMLLAGGPWSNAQTTPPSIALQDLGYRVKHWTADHGLAPGFVFSVAQPSDGYIWASSIRGVSRFDGVSFETFRNPDSDVMNFYRPRLEVDSGGRLWVLSVGGVILTHEGETFRRWGPAEGLPEGYLQWVRGDGRTAPAFWRDINGERSLHLRSEDGGFRSVPLDPSVVPYTILEDRDGVPWIHGKKNLGIAARLGDQGFEEVAMPGPDGSTISTCLGLIRNQDGNLAYITEVGIFERRDSRWQLSQPFKAPLLDFVLWAGSDKLGNTWMVMRNGVQVATPDGSVRRINPSPFEHGIGPPFCDREGCVWIPTRSGLYQFIPSAFTTWEMEAGAGSKKITAVSQDGTGRMWFAGEKELYSLAPGGSHVETYPDRELAPSVMVGAPEGGAYLRSARGLGFAADEKYTRFGNLPHSPTSTPFLSPDSDGIVWTANRRGLVTFRAPEGEYEEIPLVAEGGEISIEHLVQDSTGLFYFSQRGEGLMQYNRKDPPKRLSPPAPDTVAKRPSALLADPEDRIWLSSRGPNGLGFWDVERQRWSFAPWSKLGLPFVLPIHHGMNADLEGGFWLTTTMGPLRTDREQLARAIEAGGQPVAWQEFSRDDGLASRVCAARPDSSFRDTRGRLWIPTDAGVSVINPKTWRTIRDQIPPPPC